MPGSSSGPAIAQLIAFDGPGGAERVVAHLARQLRAAGSRVVLVVPQDGEGWLAAQLAEVDVTIEPFHLDRPLSPGAVRRLAGILRRHHVALAHSHEFTMAVYGAFAARLAGARHVITMHGGRYYAERWRRRLALRAGAALSRGLVAVSRPLADDLATQLALPKERVTVIPNGVPWDPPATPTLRRELGLGAGDRLVVAVGNLYPVKGHRWLLDAVDRVRRVHPTVHVAIAGRGAEAPALVEQARRLGLAERVHLLGLRGDVPNLLLSADVFVHPSLSEGLPLAVLEAMWAGRPIVATRVGELPTALAGGAGLLVPPADAEALARAISGVLGDAGLAAGLGRRATARARADYGVETMVRRYRSLYARAVGAAAATAFGAPREASTAPAASRVPAAYGRRPAESVMDRAASNVAASIATQRSSRR
jgi:glycosyltransferase involved in cell wall biosynthesis